MTEPRVGCVDIGGCPTIGARIISPAGLSDTIRTISTPDDHFTAAPHRGVLDSASGRIAGTRGYPTIGRGIVSAATVHIAGDSSPAPNDHLIASPHSGMRDPTSRPIRDATGCPSIGA